MRNHLRRSGYVLVLALAFAPAALSQQDQNQQQNQGQQQNNQGVEQPIQAYHSPLAGIGAGNQDENGNGGTLQPDTHPLSGAQAIGVGAPAEGHSYWQPSLSVFSTFDSNADGVTAGWVNYESFLGSVQAHRASARNDLELAYSGGGTVSSNSNLGNSVLQQFELGDTISLKRGEISFFNSTTYIPEVSFGFSGLGGISLPGTGLLGLGYGFVPEESILAARDQRLANADMAQVNYYLSPRTSITLVGGYSLLHFLGAGYFDFREPTGQVGYNYQWTRRDTVALLDNFNDFQFNGQGESIRDNRTDVSYGRRVTGRIGFEVKAGPEEVFFTVPSSTSTTGTGMPVTGPGAPVTVLTGNGGTKYLWNLESSLNYAFERASASITYDHGVNGGSGVLIGAVGDNVSVDASRQFTREFTGALRFGYAKNRSLNGPVQLEGHPNFDYWFGGADVTHAFGRYMNLVVSYQYQRETSTGPLCIGTSCGVFNRNLVSIGFTWQYRPLLF